MVKMIRCFAMYLIIMIFTTSFRPASGGEPDGMNNEAGIENYISSLYNQIEFGSYKHLSYEVFDKACRGYLNLRNEGKLAAGKEILTVCDFSLSSAVTRFWVIDLAKKKVLFHTYVAHGQGSGEEYANAFSNEFNSHQSSLGFYVTGDTYDGDHGNSLHLLGMDEGFNDAAFDRGIVVHGADYVSEKFIKGNDRLGRSWGCPAVPEKLVQPIINTIKDSTCLFIYYPEEKYLKSAYWLNKKITGLPIAGVYADMKCNDLPKPKYRLIEYHNRNGQIDSVKTIPVSQ